MKFISNEAKHSLGLKLRSKRLLFSYAALAASLAFSLLLGKVFTLDVSKVPSGINVDGYVYTIAQELTSGEPRQFNNKIFKVLDNSEFKSGYLVQAFDIVNSLFIDDTELLDVKTAYVNNAFYKYINTQLLNGRYPTSTMEVLISTDLARYRDISQGLTMTTGGDTYNVVGVFTKELCGALVGDCVDVIFDASQLSTSLSPDTLDFIKKSHGGHFEEAKLAFAGLRGIFHTFIVSDHKVPLREMNARINRLDWQYLAERTTFKDGSTIYSPNSEQEFNRFAVRGMTKNHQADAEISPVIKIVFFVCLTITIVCLVLFAIEQYNSMNERKSEIIIKNQLGSGDMYWFRFISLEVSLIVIPVLLLMTVLSTTFQSTLNNHIVVSTLTKGEAIDVDFLSYLLIFSILIGICLFVISGSVRGVRNTLRMNRVAHSDMISNQGLTKLLICLAFMLLIGGTILTYTLTKSVNNTLSSDQLGAHDNRWTIDFNYSKDFTPPLSPQSDAIFKLLDVNYAIMENQPGIDALSKSSQVNLVGQDKYEFAFFTNVTDRFFELYELDLISGRLPNTDAVDEVVINANLANLLGIGGPLKDPIAIYMKEYDYIAKIVGIVSDINFNSARGVPESVMYGLVEDPLQYYSIGFYADNKNAATEIFENYRLKLGIDDGISLKNRTETIYKINSFYQNLARSAVFIGFVMLVVLSLILHSTIQQGINSRRKELAVRVSLGSPIGKLVVEIFKGYILPLLVGAVGGAIIGWVLSYQLTTAWNISAVANLQSVLLVIVGYLVAITLLCTSQLYIQIKAPQMRYLGG